MYKLEQISTYVKSVVAATLGEIISSKLTNEDGIYRFLEKRVGYDLCQKALDLSWKWIEGKSIDEMDPWNFCYYLDDADGIDLMSYEDDTINAGDSESANIYGIMNCIILYIAYQAFEEAGEEFLPDYLWGIDDEFYAEGILDYAAKIEDRNFYEILDYCNRKLEEGSNVTFSREEMIGMFLEDEIVP